MWLVGELHWHERCLATPSANMDFGGEIYTSFTLDAKDR